MFDFDDTLIATTSSRKILFLRFLQLFTEVSPDALDRVWGRPMHEMLALLVPGADPVAITDAYHSIMELTPPAPVLPGVEQTVRGLAGMGIPLMILTSSVRKLVESDLARHGLLDYFALIWSSDEMSYAKPDPRVFLPLLEWLSERGFRIEQALYVGDSKIDYELAKQSGIQFVGITTGVTSENDFRALGASEVVSSIIRLRELLPQTPSPLS